MWICFDCKKMKARMKCRRKHRCINVDFRTTYTSCITMAIVNNIVYTTSSYGISPGERIRNICFLDSYTEKSIIERKPDVIRYGGKEIRYKILNEEEWEEVQRRAREIRYNEEINSIDDKLARIYMGIIKYGNVDPANCDVADLREGIKKYGFRFAERLRKRIEENRWISGEMKTKVLELLMGDIL